MHGPTSPAWYVPETLEVYVSMQLSERGNVKSSGVSEIDPMLASFSKQVDRTDETALRRRKKTEKSVRSDFHRIIIACIAEVTSAGNRTKSEQRSGLLRMTGYRDALLFDGLVSGISDHISSTAATATAEMPRNPAAGPNLAATRLESVVLSEAPTPDIVPTKPCPRLKSSGAYCEIGND